MTYTDEELKRWWDGLGHSGQAGLLGHMLSQSSNTDFAASLCRQYADGKPFSPKQLAAIRKWDR